MIDIRSVMPTFSDIRWSRPALVSVKSKPVVSSSVVVPSVVFRSPLVTVVAKGVILVTPAEGVLLMIVVFFVFLLH